MNLLSVCWPRLPLQVQPQLHNGPRTTGEHTVNAAEDYGSRVPGRVPEYLCHDGEWLGGLGWVGPTQAVL